VDILHQASGDSSSVSSVGVKGLDDLFDCDGSMSGSPGIVVGRSTDEGVAGMSSFITVEALIEDSLNLALSGEFGFGNNRHVDDISTPLSVHL
jgi:hypothetical protein